MSLELILFSLGRLWASFWDPLGRLGLPRASPWRHFGFPLAPLWLPWDSVGPFGAPWAPKGPSLASFWSPFGSLRTPWGHLGHHGLPRGAWDDFGSTMEVQFRASGSQVARLRTKSDLAEFSGLSALWAQSAARAAASNPTSLAPGARMT